MKKFVIDGKIPILGANDEQLGDMTVGFIIHEILWKNSSHDTLKCYDFGIRILKEKELVLDESDFRFIEEVVSKSVTSAMYKAPVIRALNKAKDESNKEPSQPAQ